MYHKHFNQNTEMKRKDYRKPTMKIVKLQQKCHILAGSGEGLGATRGGYGAANAGVDASEQNAQGKWEWN